MRLSIVSSMYQSAPYLEVFVERFIAAMATITDDYEIVLVNDGSPDNPLELAVGFRDQDGRVKVADLSRNFGHHAAIFAGLEQSKGDTVFLMDCDLEEQPEWLPQPLAGLPGGDKRPLEQSPGTSPQPGL